MGLWGLVTPQTSSPENRVHRPTVLGPQGGAPMAPPLLGGVVLLVDLLVICMVIRNILGLIGW